MPAALLRFALLLAVLAPPAAAFSASASASASAAKAAPPSFDAIVAQLEAAQARVIAAVEGADTESGAAFSTDPWEGGASGPASRGVARVIQNGRVVEKGAVSLTVVPSGTLSPARAAAVSGRTDGPPLVGGESYRACALSLVLHAASPLVPTLRGDVRFFEVEGRPGWWGGGLDLTPSYLFDEDAASFHAALADLCGAHAPAGTYAAMKAACDDYFMIPARGERRGVGGIFFDDVDADWGAPFAQALLARMADPWLPIVERRKDLPFTDAQRQWQLARRGRYLEFNLLYDRGVRFGLSPSAIERVMVSAPPLIRWGYNEEPEEGSEEARLVGVLRDPREWV